MENDKLKILFLDIDGVLLPYYKNAGHYLYKDSSIELFPKKCATVLNNIVEQTGCKIVISSDWRLSYSLKELQEIFKINLINCDLIDVTTGDFYDSEDLWKTRVKQINQWISQNSVYKYVAVDDMNLIELGKEHFVHCTKGAFEGILQTGVQEKIIKILNS